MRDSGLGLLIVGKCHQGDRPYMEDYIYATAYKEDCFMAVYDGHGGYEAAQYAYDNLWETIKTQNGFYHYQPKIVSNAIINGFMATHESMWKRRGKSFCAHNFSLVRIIGYSYVYMYIV